MTSPSPHAFGSKQPPLSHALPPHPLGKPQNRSSLGRLAAAVVVK
uniref:Uncharacterized protein n=1 Tax=Anopheles albimanus TaxID=7167 RepID=A0A182FWP9_ANOAL